MKFFTTLAKRFSGLPDFLGLPKDGAAIHSLRDAINFCKFFYRNRKYILKHRDVLREESKDYMRVLEEPDLEKRPDLSTFGFIVDGHIVRQLDDGSHYDILIATYGGITIYAFEDIANRMFLYSNFGDRTYENLCRMYAKDVKDMVLCRVGTERLWEVLNLIRNEEDERSKLHLHYQDELDHAEEVEDDHEKMHLKIPSAVQWIHADNELVSDPAYYNLPALSDEWEALRIKLNHAESINDIEWVGVRTQRLPKSIRPESIGHITHANYGEFGYKNDCVKAGFKGFFKRTQRSGLLSSTGSVAIGSHIPAALPRFNRNDNATILYGMAGRIGREPIPLADLLKIQRDFPYVTRDRNTIAPYFDHAVAFIINLLTRKGLQPQNITPEDSWRWLASTHFPLSKKQAYLESYKRVIRGDEFIPAAEFDNTHKAFPKNESYLSGDKPQRMILAGSYEMSAVLGPACAILGNYFFSLKYTSKKIAEFNRPRVALRYFPEAPVILNDMSAFEGSIDGWVKEHCENHILEHFFPNIKPWINRTLEPLHIYCKDAQCMAGTMRCSGDPQTSLGNSLTNLASIVAAYCWSEGRLLSFENIERNLTAWVEGDDSLVSWFNTWAPNEIDKFNRYKNAFIMMGFATKMEKKDFVGDAGYCSMFFNTDCELCPRVAQTFLDFPWDHNNQYNRGQELLYLKASSLHHVCPGQPLTWALARYYSPPAGVISRLPWNSYEYEEFLREGYHVTINGNFMDIEIPAQVFGIEPSDSSRQLFFEKYGIEPDEQKQIEKRILKYGPAGLIKAKHSFRHNWQVLQTLCQVDGINFADCRAFYKRNFEMVPYNDIEVISMSITSGEGQKPLIKEKRVPHLRFAQPLPKEVKHELIDPYSFHVNKCQERFLKHAKAVKTVNYKENNYLRFWTDYKHITKKFRHKVFICVILVSMLFVLPTAIITTIKLIPVIFRLYRMLIKYVKFVIRI